jgi:hypothetical protein
MEDVHTQHEAPKWKAVYTIVDRENGGKSFWVRIGTAWTNRDQSLTVKLDASPTNGKLHIRDADPDRPPYGKRSDGARENNGARGDGNGSYDPFGSFSGARRGDGNGGAA